MKPAIYNAKQSVLLTILLVFFQTSVTLGQTCNNWLNVPSALTGVTIGDLDVGGDKITIEAVFNGTGDTTETLVSKHSAPNDVNYFFGSHFAQITTTNGLYQIASNCDFVKNKTYHVAMVYNGSTLKIYRNGFLMGQVGATGNLITNNLPATIGEYAYGLATSFIPSAQVFKGLINEVRIWNVERSLAEIKNYMNLSLPNPTTQTGLLGYYIFDDLVNKQGNTNFDGTLRGGATINEINPNCNFVADSCGTVLNDCNNWLYNPSVSSSVNIGDLDVPGNQITVEATINRTAAYVQGAANNNEGDIVSKHNTPSDVNYLLRPNNAFITTTNGYFATPDVCQIELNKTYHVAMVYNGSTLKFYRNGFLMSQVNATGNLIQNDWSTRFGHYTPAFWNTQFIGYINNVRIWNVARTQAEIKGSITTPLFAPTTQPGLLAFYQFDNLINKQGNATYNGVINGSASIRQTNPNCTLALDSCNIVTPVTIASFTTKAVNNSYITANWYTEEEYGIEQYMVQRSASANGGFVTIGAVKAVTTRRNNSYSFTDNTAKPNTNYFYRLKILENNGSVKYSETRQERLSTKSLFTSVYPNPATQNPTLTIRNFNGKASLLVFNSLGQSVFSKQLVVNNVADIEVKLNSQPKGTYWLQLYTDNQIITKKLIRL